LTGFFADLATGWLGLRPPLGFGPQAGGSVIDEFEPLRFVIGDLPFALLFGRSADPFLKVCGFFPALPKSREPTKQARATRYSFARCHVVIQCRTQTIVPP